MLQLVVRVGLGGGTEGGLSRSSSANDMGSCSSEMSSERSGLELSLDVPGKVRMRMVGVRA